MKIAISINADGLLVGEGKGDGGSLAYLETFALTALVGLKIYPKNAMLGYHGMLDRAHGNGDGASVDRHYGYMLFMARLDGTGLELSHILTAALHRNTGIMDHTDKISAMLTNIKLVVVTHWIILLFFFVINIFYHIFLNISTACLYFLLIARSIGKPSQ